MTWALLFLLLGGEVPLDIQIKLASKEYESLRAESRQLVSAQIKIDRNPWREAQVRLKGKGTFQPIDQKPSLTVTAPGLKLHLNNSADDPSYMCEIVGSALARRAGMEVPKTGHAKVRLNGRRLGLYVFKEAFTTTEAPEPADLSSVDMEQFATFVSLEVLMGHWDGYSLRRNNFHAFVGSSGRVIFWPSGMDQLFGKPDLTWRPEMTGPLASELMSTPEGRRLYEQQFRKLLEIFDSNELCALMKGRGEEADDLCERIRQREAFLKRELSKKD